MFNLCTVHHSSHLKVGPVCQCPLYNFLVECDADVVTYAEYAIRRLWQSEWFGFHHVLHNGYFIA